MKGYLIVLLAVIGTVAFGRGFFQDPTPSRPLTDFVPEGSLLYIEAKDLAGLLKEWNESPQKSEWIKSDNHSVFEKSRLFIRLQKAQEEFAVAAGIPPDMKFATEAAGDQSALALFDIGNLEFLYVSHLHSARSMESALWQSRGKFETRNAGGTAFYVRKDEKSNRVVAFAMLDDYLLLSTREDLLAAALQLASGTKARTIRDEAWFAKATVAATGKPGDLRMILNLEKIAVAPHFRTYWIQQNITEMQGYSAAVSDLYRTPAEYREDRVLIKKTVDASPESVSRSSAGQQAVADLAKVVPSDFGVYRAEANPSAEKCLALLQNRILAPHLGPAPVQQLAPKVSLGGGEVGSAADLETRIDVAPAQRTTDSSASGSLLKLLNTANPRAVLQVHSTHRNQDGVLLSISTGIVIAAASDWDSQAVRNALQAVIRPGLTASHLGVSWKNNPNGTYELDGLSPLLTATRGTLLFVSNDADLLTALWQNKNSQSIPPAQYLAGFSHERERGPFLDLTRILDRSSGARQYYGGPQAEREPEYFSGNIGSLSETFAGVDSEFVTARESGATVAQSVTYHWKQ